MASHQHSNSSKPSTDQDRSKNLYCSLPMIHKSQYTLHSTLNSTQPINSTALNTLNLTLYTNTNIYTHYRLKPSHLAIYSTTSKRWDIKSNTILLRCHRIRIPLPLLRHPNIQKKIISFHLIPTTLDLNTTTSTTWLTTNTSSRSIWDPKIPILRKNSYLIFLILFQIYLILRTYQRSSFSYSSLVLLYSLLRILNSSRSL